MKLFRFLTSLIIIQLLALGVNVSGQDIADFEFRKTNPSLPFRPASEIDPLDDDGLRIPYNQCNDYLKVCPYMNRCGFSAEPAEVVSSDEVKVDLSPLTFECFDSGCEYEYTNSVGYGCLEPTFDTRIEIPVSPEEAKIEMQNVFRQVSSIKEIIDAEYGNTEFDNGEYVPYVEPTAELGLDPFSELSAPRVVTIKNAELLLNSWIDSIGNHLIVRNPVEWADQKLLDLECQYCGSPLATLFYNLKNSIVEAEEQLLFQAELQNAKTKATMIMGFSNLLRTIGDSLHTVSDNLDNVVSKQIEIDLQ